MGPERGCYIKHTMEATNVINVRFLETKMYHKISPSKIAANFVIIKKRDNTWLTTKTCQRFAGPWFLSANK